MNGATLLKCTFFSYFRELYNVKMVTKNCHVFTTAQNMVRTETLFGRISTDENDLLLRYECPCPKIQILRW